MSAYTVRLPGTLYIKLKARVDTERLHKKITINDKIVEYIDMGVKSETN